MSDDQFIDPDEEQQAAADRIARIRGEGRGSTTGAPLDDLADDPIARARARARAARTVSEEEPIQPRSRTAARPAPAGGARGRQALIVVGGVVGIGVVVLLIILLIAALGGGGGLALPFVATATPTETATPTATETPLPTETPTPTRQAPNLALPPLTCIFQSGEGCFDYCQRVENAGECSSARAFVQAQGADPDLWLSCIAPGPGANVRNPQECLEEAWRSLNP